MPGLFLEFSLLFSFLFISCPMESVVSTQTILEYELSNEFIKIGEPVELIVKWYPDNYEKDTIISVMKLNNIEKELLNVEE